MVTASSDGTERVWDISTIEKGDAFAIACARLGKNTDFSYMSLTLVPICGEHPPAKAHLTAPKMSEVKAVAVGHGSDFRIILLHGGDAGGL